MTTLLTRNDQALSKMPPHSTEAEQGLLSCVLLKNDKIFTVMGALEPEEIFSRNHRNIYQCMINLGKEKQVIDILSISDELRKMGKYLEVGGIDYLTEIEDFTPTAEVTGHFIGIIKRCAYFRDMASIFASGYDRAFAMRDDVETAMSDLNGEISRISQRFHSSTIGNEVYSPKELAKMGIENVAERMEKKEPDGIKTGFQRLDGYINGLKPLTIISAGTGVGKTALALNIAESIGVVQKIPTLYLNYEMQIEDLLIRLQALSTGIPANDISSGNLKGDAFKEISKYSNEIAMGNLHVTGCEPKNIDHTIDLIHKNFRIHGIRVVVVDYLGELEADKASSRETDYETYGRWLQALKDQCNGLGIKLIVLAQLNRMGEDDVPGMSKIGGSWKIAQKADVFLIFGHKQDRGFFIKIAKNRNGACPVSVDVMFHKETQRIEEE